MTARAEGASCGDGGRPAEMVAGRRMRKPAAVHAKQRGVMGPPLPEMITPNRRVCGHKLTRTGHIGAPKCAHFALVIPRAVPAAHRRFALVHAVAEGSVAAPRKSHHGS